MDKTDFQLKWVDVVITEYNSLRAEVSDSLKNQQSVINYGLTAIGVLIAFSANLWGKEKIIEGIYVFFIPFICNLILLIWNGEVRRMSRAGQYIKLLEDKLQEKLRPLSGFSERALNWETYLRLPRNGSAGVGKAANSLPSWLPLFGGVKTNKIKSNYIAIIVMFGILSILSILLAFGHSFSMFSHSGQYAGTASIGAWLRDEGWWLAFYSILLLADIFLCLYHYRYFQSVKK